MKYTDREAATKAAGLALVEMAANLELAGVRLNETMKALVEVAKLAVLIKDLTQKVVDAHQRFNDVLKAASRCIDAYEDKDTHDILDASKKVVS